MESLSFFAHTVYWWSTEQIPRVVGSVSCHHEIKVKAYIFLGPHVMTGYEMQA